ncbi:serine hydrolase domain-containing protein [Luteimonas sp. RIT-PG2_3]
MPPALATAPVLETPAALGASLDAVIEQALSRRLVGCVVLVMRDGKPVYQHAAGLADREAGRPMQLDTLFRLASVSKPIVSTAALALVAAGRLELDAPIHRWLPDFRPALADGRVPDISLRQLLTHTSGLGYRFLESDGNGPYARAGVSDGLDHVGLSLQDNLRRLASAPLLFAPGSQWRYSLGIDVAGAMIEAATGQPLAAALQALVGAPLGWRDTGFIATAQERLAAVYINDAPLPRRMHGAETIAPFPDTVGIAFDPARAFSRGAFASGGAGMVGSAIEFLQLLDTLRQGGAGLLPPAVVEDMARNQTGDLGPPDMPGTGFGLGFSVLHDPAAARSPESAGTWRWGGAYGHAWFVDRARGISVVALTNTLYEGMSGAFVGDVRDAIYASLSAREASR